ncbi:MAG: hypothetical protein ABL923_12940 [Burkholderiaceae bacterium]
MKKVMHQVSVNKNENGEIVLTQALGDMNEPDPEIIISTDQSGLLASWIYEAGNTNTAENTENKETIPVHFYANGPEVNNESLSVYNNSGGMIILKIDDDTFIEVSPIMAKRLRDQLSTAIRCALTDMLRPDAES